MTVSYIIPFHNEEKNCRLLISRIIQFSEKKKISFEIIPVDDRSTDKTTLILKELAAEHRSVKPVFRRDDGKEKGNSMGKALTEGTKKARGKYIIWTMGDMADSVYTYQDILNKLASGFDLVFGSRYMPGGSRGNLDLLKANLSSTGTLLALIIFAVPVHDITNAFRGFKKSIFSKIKLEEAGFAISPEFAIKAHIKGFRLGEVPTTYSNRVQGVSNFKLIRMTESYLKLYAKLFIQKILNKLR